MRTVQFVLAIILLCSICVPTQAADPAPLSWSTYFGATNTTENWDIATDSNGDIFVTGRTAEGFPTTVGAYDRTHNGDYDCFVAKFDGTTGALIWSTYLGTTAYDEGEGVLPLDDGSVVVCGVTSGQFSLPSNAFDTFNGMTDDFVIRISADGSKLEAGMYVGGTAGESCWERNRMAVDDDGNIYVTGYTSSTDFPTSLNAVDSTLGAPSDAFVVKLTPDLDGFVYATYLGGTGDEIGKALAIDDDGICYVTGMTQSENFPATPGAYDTDHSADWDAFVAAVNSNATALVFATFLGGVERDYGMDIQVEQAGTVVVGGKTHSLGYPTTLGAYDRSFNGVEDVFISRLSADGASLLASTFVGGNDSEIALALELDSAGNIWFSGETASDNFPRTKNAYDRKLHGAETSCYVAALKPNFSKLLFSSYLGTKQLDRECHITVGLDGNPIVSGNTVSRKFPITPGAYQINRKSNPCSFITKIGVK